MTKCPVCAMEVDEKKAPASTNYQGHHYSFCSKQCKEMFEKNPERYTQKAGAEMGM